MGNVVLTGSCIYCGQIRQIEGQEGMSEEERNRKATELCDCKEAKTAQEKAETRTKAEKNIHQMFGEDFPETEEILLAAVKYIESGEIDSITIDTGMRVKGKVSMTSKGNIKVERTKTLKTSLES